MVPKGTQEIARDHLGYLDIEFAHILLFRKMGISNSTMYIYSQNHGSKVFWTLRACGFVCVGLRVFVCRCKSIYASKKEIKLCCQQNAIYLFIHSSIHSTDIY